MRDMLPACFCIVKSDIRFDWMYYLWLFCWDYVARHNQYFIRKISGRWNGYVCIGPGIVGRVTQSAGDNIRAGMGVGLLFPVILLIMLFIFARQKFLSIKFMGDMMDEN